MKFVFKYLLVVLCFCIYLFYIPAPASPPSSLPVCLSLPLYLLVILISSSESCCSVNLSIISLPYLYFSYLLLGFVFDPWYESPLRWLISKNKFSFYRLPSVFKLFSFCAVQKLWIPCTHKGQCGVLRSVLLSPFLKVHA